MSIQHNLKGAFSYLGKIGDSIEEEYQNSTGQPELLLFSQHGMTDNNRAMGVLARKVAPTKTLIIAPNLGFFNTFLNIEPLIYKVERICNSNLEKHKNVPVRVIATSMGGVIWTEVLIRNPQWWSRIESLVFLGVPIGGADLARIIDPFNLGIGAITALGKNRRLLAEKITAKIPTLVVAGNTTGGGDGTIPLESTKLKQTYCICLDGVSHPELRTHPDISKVIREFWAIPQSVPPRPSETPLSQLIDHFRAVPGITDADSKDFKYSQIIHRLSNGITINSWQNILGVKHIFIGNSKGQCEYASFVGWRHNQELNHAIKKAKDMFS